MPGPPPPPPMAPAAPPPPVFKPPKGTNDRDALLKSIQKGTKLKKTVTNDKSAPAIPGAVRNVKNNNNDSINSNVISPMKNHSSIQMELKKQLANDNRNRGPPPPAPNRMTPGDSNGLRQNPMINGINLSQINLRPVNMNSPRGTPQANPSTLHRKAKSNANLSSLEMPDDATDSVPTLNKPSFNSGKPNLAPKPPVLNGKLLNANQRKPNKPVSRTHSLKSPRSPSPESDPNPKFGTVRHMSSIIGQSLANSSTHNSRSRPALNVRPSGPPPSVPAQHIIPSSPSQQAPPPPPPSKMIAPVKHPNHAPPPPPTLALPQAPNHAPPPPPPPHKTLPLPPQLSPAAALYKQHTMSNSNNNNSSNPPPPPPRHSSMRDVVAGKTHIDLEEKFKDLFQSSDRFPKPPQFMNVRKIYNSKQQGQLKPGYIV